MSEVTNGLDFKIDENHFNSYKSNPEFTSLLSELELYNTRFKNIPSAQRELALYLILNNKTDIVSELNSLLYKRHVPTIEEFLTEEYLPGHPITTPGNIWKDELIEIFNPSKSYYEHILTGCFSEDTKILKADGSLISFKELVDKNVKELEIISFDENKKEYIKTVAIDPRITKEVDELLELELENGEIIRCTPDHKFLTKNRGWIEAKDLNEEDELENINKNKIGAFKRWSKEEYKEKISESMKGNTLRKRKLHTEDSKTKISESMKGKRNRSKHSETKLTR